MAQSTLVQRRFAEDFAESYARYLGPGASDPAFAEKRQFLRELVFSGDPWTLKARQAL